MLNVYVLDSSAESRNKLVKQLNELLESEAKPNLLLPRFSIKPIARQELKYQSEPDLLFIGDEIVTLQPSDISSIRKTFLNAKIIAKTGRRTPDLITIEQLARLGVDDIFSDETSGFEFIRKIILLVRSKDRHRTGNLIVVDSGKGGLGVTSIVAALGETLLQHGKRTALVDFDFETQDLSRFLQVRPFFNENLQLLFDQDRSITEDTIKQTCSQVWEDEDKLYCIPPIADSDALSESGSTYPRILLSFLEEIDQLFDCVIVDIGCAKGGMLRTLYRAADKVLFVVNNDPAAIFASIQRISRIKSYLSAGASIFLVGEHERSKFSSKLCGKRGAFKVVRY